MPISRSRDFIPVVLPAGKLATAIGAAFSAIGQPPPTDFGVLETLPDGSQSTGTLSVAELDRICDLTQTGLTVNASAGHPGPQTWHYLAVNGGRPGRASVHAQAPDAAGTEALLSGVMEAAGLQPFIEPPPAEAEEIDLDIERASVQPDTRTRLRAFLSFRFATSENDAVATYVARLLELLDVDVITGRSYEPRPLGVKVADRLAGVDFLALIIGADGQSAWTRDEIATARANGTPVVPLVAHGASFEPGLFGDLEYITFEADHPGDIAISLIEAVLYVRRTRTSKL